MALIGYTITVVAKQDNPYNVLPETDISIRKNSDNTLVNIYADEAGLIPIAQLGAKTDSNGQFTFYADASLGVLKAVWTNGGVIATELLDKSDHSRLVNRNAVGAHDATSIDFSQHVPQNASFNYVKAGSGTIGANVRDTFLVSRTLSTLTDCHAFADKTIISNATDSGTYGTFDATTEVAGSHTQSHQFSFQDRAKFSGSGQITTWGNIIWPEHTGTGHIGVRYNWDVKDISLTGGGTVGTNIGINIRDLQKANSNTAIGILQSSGYSVYAPNAGAWLIGGAAQINGTATHKGTSLFEGTNYLGGNTKVGGYTNGTAPLVGVALTVEKNGLSTRGFVDVNSLGFSTGVSGDGKLQYVVNAVSRLTVGNSSEGYDIYPAADGTQKLGRADNPFKSVVLKDTANGNSYKIEVTNGALVVSLA